MMHLQTSLWSLAKGSRLRTPDQVSKGEEICSLPPGKAGHTWQGKALKRLTCVPQWTCCKAGVDIYMMARLLWEAMRPYAESPDTV